MRHAIALVACAACTDNTVVIAPIVDIPGNDTAQAIGLDSLTLSVAHAGAEVDITSATFSRGDLIELPNVPFGDDLVVHMVGRVGTTEIAYGRTCRFAVRPDGRVPSPHLYFSREVKFGSLSQQPLPRNGGAGMMYRDGSGLLVAGTFPNESGDPVPLTQIERFDPNTGTYDTLHDIERRFDAAVAIVGNGPDSRMVIVGGRDMQTGLGADFVEVIEAERNTDRQYERFFEPRLRRVGLSATTLSDGRVIVIGGRTADGSTNDGKAAGIVAEISVASGTTAIRQLPAKAELAFPRYGHTATRLTDELGAAVLVAGGLDDTGLPVAQAELYKPLAEGFSMQFTAQMVVPRWGHRAVRLPDGSVLIVGGLTIDPLDPNREQVPVDTIEVFSPLDASFVTFPNGANEGKLDVTAGLIGISATALPDGRVLIAGGQRTVDGPALSNAFIARLDPVDGDVDVVATDRLAVPRTNHQATLLCDGTVLVAGGTQGQAQFERYNPTAVGRR
jgi:hypothetical protein